jgi:hypothetical protein
LLLQFFFGPHSALYIGNTTNTGVKIRGLLFISLSLLFLISCSNDDIADRQEEKNLSTFQVLRIKSTSTEKFATGRASEWSQLSNRNFVRINVCFRDAAFDEPVKQEMFEIKTPLATFTELAGDDGCLTWNEVVPYTYCAPQKYLDYPIQITGLSTHQGQVRIPLAINPWEKDQKAILDLRYDKSVFDINQSVLSAKDMNDLCTQPHYRLTKLNLVRINNTSNSTSSNLYYDFDLRIELKKIAKDGTPEYEVLKNGLFQAHIRLVEVKEDREYLISKSDNILLNFEDKNARGHAVFEIPKNIDLKHQNPYVLYMEIFPLKNKLFGSSNAKIHLKNLNSSIGLRPQMLEGAGPVNLLEKETSEEKFDETGEYSRNDRGVEITSVKLKPGSITNPEAWDSLLRVRSVRASICLNDNTDTQPIPLTKTELKVTIEKNQQTYETDSNGCIYPQFEHAYNIFECEKFYTKVVKIDVLSGRHKGAKKAAEVAFNPHNPDDFSYHLDKERVPDRINCKAPQVDIADMTYYNDSIHKDRFYLNKLLHLSYTKKFEFSFEPKLNTFGSYQGKRELLPITTGSLSVKAYLLVPRSAEVDYHNPNWDNFEILSATSFRASPKRNGKVDLSINFPFLFSDSQYLVYKNLLVLEIESKDQGDLSSGQYILPFYTDSDKPRTVSVDQIDNKLPEKWLSKANNWINKKIKVQPLSNTAKRSPIDIYRGQFEAKGLGSKVKRMSLTGTRGAFNNFPPINDIWQKGRGKNKDEFYTSITKGEMRSLTTMPGPTSNGLLKKFCRAFYPLPSTKRTLNYFQGIKISHIGSEDFKDCMKHPNRHIERIPLTHIDRFLGKGDSDSLYKAKFITDDKGDIQKGEAFFAAYGDRSSVNLGDRTSELHATQVSYGLEGPAPYYIGLNQSTTWSYEMYQMKNNAKMYAAFKRDYISRKIDLIYNSLTLQMSAYVKHCVALIPKRGSPVQLHLCRDKAPLQKLQETWFFIGDSSADQSSIISDGNRPSDGFQSQLIRGQFNYNRLWSRYEKENVLLVMKQINKVDPSDAFHSYLDRYKGDIPYQNYVDNSFPGLFIPPAHTPINSCNGCQDR